MKMPDSCPFCEGNIRITGFKCEECGSSVTGSFERMGISVKSEDWEFIRLFIRARGNLKKLGEMLDLSYPTVNSRLSRIRKKMGFSDYEGESSRVLDALEQGEIDVQEALEKLEKEEDLNE